MSNTTTAFTSFPVPLKVRHISDSGQTLTVHGYRGNDHGHLLFAHNSDGRFVTVWASEWAVVEEPTCDEEARNIVGDCTCTACTVLRSSVAQELASCPHGIRNAA